MSEWMSDIAFYTIIYYVSPIVGPIASALVNRYGCRPVCVAGSLISSVAFVLATFSTSVDILMITYGVLGGKQNVLYLYALSKHDEFVAKI